MILKKRSCNLFEMLFWKQFAPCSSNCSKGGTHVITPERKNLRVDLKCAWKGRDPKLFAPIAFNKNGWKSNKNLEAMTEVTKAQLFK
jgi:hypothetical protein